MPKHQNLKIVAFVGLPGSGISTAVEYVRQRHVPGVYFGSVILNGLTKAGLDRTPDNERTYREQLRVERGKVAVVNAVLPQIYDLIDAGQKRIVLDGLYSWTEYKVLKHEFPTSLTVIALTAPKHLRYRRLRDRLERPMTEAQAAARDWAEIENLEKGGPIAAADYYLPNASSPEQLQAAIDQLLHQLDF